MPELPEVETVRRGLEQVLSGRSIQSVRVSYSRMIVSGSQTFCQDLSGQGIKGVRRRGKYLIFDLTDCLLISHLRMEGKYQLFPDQVPDNKHFHVFFELDNGSTLVYQDVRKFGTMELLAKSAETAYFSKKKLGPEPTEQDFDLITFEAALVKSHKPIKSALLAQNLVVGLGNIYVDEALWKAEIDPRRLTDSLSHQEIQDLRTAIIQVLELGIAQGGSTIRTYQNSFGENGSMQDYLQVYGQKDQPCARCGQAIDKIKLAGRGTHFCPWCQK